MQSSIFGDLAIVVGIILAAAALFIAMVGFGFFLGRKTIIPYERKAEVFDPGEPGLFEHDPYEVAMSDPRDLKGLK